jgi:hypothetical protein
MIELENEFTLNLICVHSSTDSYLFEISNFPVEYPFRVDIPQNDEETKQRIIDFFNQARKL